MGKKLYTAILSVMPFQGSSLADSHQGFASLTPGYSRSPLAGLDQKTCFATETNSGPGLNLEISWNISRRWDRFSSFVKAMADLK